MQSVRFARPSKLFSASVAGLALALAVASTPADAVTHAKRGSAKLLIKHATTVKPKVLGQRGIEDDRATQIQQALVKSGYLTGEPSGHWDAATEAAMGKLQADNGWQTKLVPDARALIKLGLGPNNESAPPSNTVAQR